MKYRSHTSARSALGLIAGVAAIGATATALWVQQRARRAERENPPRGKFVEVDGVRLHCIERGSGPPVVLLHGNAVSLEDFEASGLFDALARDHRVIAFDRPGFGHSTRPRDRLWTPAAQAKALHDALRALGVTNAVVVGHSFGALVAAALALDYPADVGRLVLLGGYYYPALRVDALLAAPVALPVIGDVMRYTVTALTGRAMFKGLIKGMFAPRDIPPTFAAHLSREMLLRPLQLRVNAEDAAFMMPAASALAARYGELRLPVSIFAGADDRVVDPDDHSARLHAELSRSELSLVPRTGHMVHYAVPGQIVRAIVSTAEPGAFEPG